MKLVPFIIIALLIVSCDSKVEHPPGFKELDKNLAIAEASADDSGLMDDKNLQLIMANCTACHSAKMITQNRATREGWKNMITWMQETQKLWDLGENEDIILDYLEKYYSPEMVDQRRSNLKDIEWYTLD